MDTKEKMESQRITPEDLMWHLDATERELREHYIECANAMNRITQIKSTVRMLLAQYKRVVKLEDIVLVCPKCGMDMIWYCGDEYGDSSEYTSEYFTGWTCDCDFGVRLK